MMRVKVIKTSTVGQPTIGAQCDSELLKKAEGNLNRWVNGLIEQALDQPTPDWDAHFRRPRRKFHYTADEVRRMGR